MPTPGKGPRTLVTARISQSYFDKLDQYVALVGTTKSDFIGELITTALDDVDLDHVQQNQEKLPLSA